MGNVDLRLSLYLRTEMLRVADDADDLAKIRSLGAPEIQSFADWIFAWEETPRQSLVDGYHLRRLQPICGGKPAPVDDRNLHRLEIARADRADIRHEKISRGQRWMPLNTEAHTSPVSGKRQIVRDRRRFHARQRLNTSGKLLKKFDALLFVRILRFGKRQAHGENVARVESEPRPAKMTEAFNHQSGADQQDEREGHFGNHEQAGKSAAAKSGHGRASSFFQRLIQIEP